MQEIQKHFKKFSSKVDDLLFDVLSLEYHETLQAWGFGHDADKQLEEAVEHFQR